MEPLEIPAIFRAGRLFLTSLGKQGLYQHRIGGACTHLVKGTPRGERALQLLVTLDATDPRLSLPSPFRELPLLYGFTYDACDLDYSILANRVVQVDRLEPNRSSEDWPYADYPDVFPELPFDLDAGVEIDRAEAASLAWQGFENSLADLLVIVPPNPAYGVSLWGPEGDAEQVQVIFSIVTSTMKVSVRNQCT